MAKSPFYITTAIAYPNGVPHIGHAYEAIATDAIARFMRLDGYDVFFLTGTDEHGQKIQQTAAREGMTARQLVDRNVQRFRAMVERMNCSNDDFIRTTEPRHYRASSAIWERMAAAGDIYLDKYSGWYSVRDEAFYDESETRLDAAGQRIGPQGTPVEWVQEESYFFRLSAYQDKLLDLYKRIPDFVLPRERLNEVESFVRGGLKDLSISRTTFDWGVPVPGDPKHIMYVWVDALTNYITAVDYPDTESAKFKRYWPAALHVIGKDIVRFHAVYWPAFLMSAGIAVPQKIFSHGFLFNRGEKISKSVGNVIDPFDLADAYGVDQLRFFLLREIPFGQDGNYSHEAIITRINADLSNDLGNLAQRSLTMVARQLDGVLPQPGALSEADKDILEQADGMIGKAREMMQTRQLHQVLNAVWAVVAEANRYFAGQEPWALAKTDRTRQGTVLYVTAEVLRQVAILVQPAIPHSASLLLDQLGIPGDERAFDRLGGTHRIAPGTKLAAPSPVFPRYVEPDANARPDPSRTSTTEIITFAEALSRTKDKGKSLLVGNGFSIHYFAYKNLLEKAGLDPARPLLALFDKLHTVDFEAVIKALEDASLVENVYQNTQQAAQFTADADTVREALVHAIREVHPAHKEDVKAEIAKCVQFLSHFDDIYTLNYDVLLYWVLLEDTKKFQDGFGLAKPVNGFRRPFNPEAYCNVYNLHGGLHLFPTEDDEVEKRIDQGAGVIDAIAETITKAKRLPLYVAEGTSIAKLARIYAQPYLRHCYKKLQESAGHFFVYGHSASTNDAHIYNALFMSKIDHLYFCIHQPTAKIEDIAGELARYQKRNSSKIQWTFVNSETVPVWK